MIDISKMQRNGLFHFHKGFYLTDNVINSLRSVRNEHYDEIQCEDDDATDYLYTNSELFLHGSCNLLALALHDEFGYEVYEIRDNEDRMFHIFCKATYHGQDAYIDVRGITTDFAECLSEFSNRMYRGYYITRRDLGEDRALDGEGDITGYRFAKDIVEKYRSYYDVSF